MGMTNSTNGSGTRECFPQQEGGPAAQPPFSTNYIVKTHPILALNSQQTVSKETPDI